MNLSKKSLVFRTISRKTLYLFKVIKYKMDSLFYKTDEKLVVFSSFNGKSYACSPKAIYEYMLNDEKYKDYKFIWFFKDTKKYKKIAENKNTEIVKYESKK